MSELADIELTPEEKRRLDSVLNDAYDPIIIKRALGLWVNRELYQYVSPNADMRDIAYELIVEAAREGWTAELIICAYCEMPEHAGVCAFFESLRARVLAARSDLNVQIAEAEARLRPTGPAERLKQLRRERAAAADPAPEPRLSYTHPLDYDIFVTRHNLHPQVRVFRAGKTNRGLCGFSMAEPHDELLDYLKERLFLEMQLPDPLVPEYRRTVEADLAHLYAGMFEEGEAVDGDRIRLRVEQVLRRSLSSFFDRDDVQDALLVLVNQYIPRDVAGPLVRKFFESAKANLAELVAERQGAFVIVWVECADTPLVCEGLEPIPSPFELEKEEIAAWIEQRLHIMNWPEPEIKHLSDMLERKVAPDSSRRGLFLALKSVFQHAQTIQTRLAP